MGPGFDCVFGESEQGIIQRCIREIFNQLSTQTDRNFVINIGWVEVIEDEINDLFETGNVQILSVSEAFQMLQFGMSNRNSEPGHSLFLLTLEQQWVSSDGLIQHKLSTASFCDLIGTERMFVMNSINQHQTVPKNLSLQHLERIVQYLSDPYYNCQNKIPYEHTTLTTLLKDSFGGRAQTLLILCVSPDETHINETLSNLQFASMAQCIRNFVVMNTFSDNNTQLPVATQEIPLQEPTDTFGLQFAASQWLKLVSNAEGLLSKLVTSNSLTEKDRQHIEDWLFLKAECEECLSSGDIPNGNRRHLGPIEEAEEPSELSDNDTNCQQNSDNESESESQHPDMEDKLCEFRRKTDEIVAEKYLSFLQSHPKALFESNDSVLCSESTQGRRRKSIQPGTSLSSTEIASLNNFAIREKNSDILANSVEQLRKINPADNIKKKIIKIEMEIDSYQQQTKEIEDTISSKQKLIQEHIKNSDTRNLAKKKLNKKKKKIEAEYENTKKQLRKGNCTSEEIKRLSELKQRLKNLVSVKNTAEEQLKDYQDSLKESCLQSEQVKKCIKKLKHEKKSLEDSLKTKNKNDKLNLGGGSLKKVSARISHCNHVLEEKSQNLKLLNNEEEKQSLRHEIRNLRYTKDTLVEQRCFLDKKLKKEKSLSQKEERKLLVYDEAIHCIDEVMEFKNELILGRRSIDTSESLQHEKGEKLLMAQLNKLSTEEMRTLLYKYFTKVIDLKDSSKKLEIDLMNLESDRDSLERKVILLWNEKRQAKLEGERHTVLLQRQHEIKINQMLRHLADETSVSSSLTSKAGYSDEIELASNRHKFMLGPPMQFDSHLTKYKPLDKIKEKKNMFSKFALTKYTPDKRKVHDLELAIPHHHYKQLQISSVPATTVTREKNKIIIQDTSRRN